MATEPLPELADRVGEELYVSDWLTIDQDMIDTFAEATGDHQWIHVDVERARAESPFGGTIAHGFLTLSLLSRLIGPALETLPLKQGLNYGCDKVRFPQPVPAGGRIRARFRLEEVEAGQQGAVSCKILATVELEGASKPACVAEQILLLFP